MNFFILLVFILHCTRGLSVGGEKDALVKEIENLQRDLKTSNVNHGKLDQSLPQLVTEIQKIDTNGKTDQQVKDRLVVVNRAVRMTAGAVTKFTSGQPLKIISGIFDISSITLITSGNVIGAVAPVVINVVNSAFACFYNSPSSQPTIVINEALNDFHDTVSYHRMNSFTAVVSTVYQSLVAVHINAQKRKWKLSFRS